MPAKSVKSAEPNCLIESILRKARDPYDTRSTPSGDALRPTEVPSATPTELYTILMPFLLHEDRDCWGLHFATLAMAAEASLQFAFSLGLQSFSCGSLLRDI